MPIHPHNCRITHTLQKPTPKHTLHITKTHTYTHTTHYKNPHLHTHTHITKQVKTTPQYKIHKIH